MFASDLKIGGRPWCVVGGLALIAAGVSGCGGAFDASLSGTVTLDGTPLTRGNVTLKPVTTEGSAAYARIDESGRFSVSTGREGGLPVGDYKVTVVAREPPVARPDAQGPLPAGPMITPEWYRRTDTSGLSVTVEPGSNTYDIELSSEPPAGWQANAGGRNRRGR